MPAEMTTGRRIQFIGESRLPISNLHPARPALPCPALPCPDLPRPALPPTHVICVHVKSSPCHFKCEKLQQAYKQNVPCKSCLYFSSSQSQEASVTQYLCSCSRAFSNHTAEEKYVSGIYGHLIHTCTIPHDSRTSTSKSGFQKQHTLCCPCCIIPTPYPTVRCPSMKCLPMGWTAHEMSTYNPKHIVYL